MLCRSRSIDEVSFLHFVTGVLLGRVVNPEAVAGVLSRLRNNDGTDWPSRNHKLCARQQTRGPTLESQFAEAVAEICRIKVALLGDDLRLLREAMHTLLCRIELRFGPHPRRRKATKILSGILQLRTVFRFTCRY